MLFLSLYVLAVIVIIMFAVVARTRPGIRAVVGRAWLKPAQTARPDAGPAPAALAVRPGSLEGMIVALLIAGEITSGQYRHAVEELAAQDEASYPLTVPTDPGSAGA